MKKVFAILLAALMLVSLAGCAGAPAGAQAAGTTTGTTGAPADNGEIYEVVMQYPTLGTTPQDIQRVEDAINARTEPEIGVHVTLYPVSAFELNSTTNLMVSSGEKLDLMMSLFEGGISTYVNKGILIELDELVAQYGKDIVAAEGVAMSGGYFGGKLYAVPTEEKMARVKGFMARKDILERNGVEYDVNHIYTLEELGEIFEKVKAGEGERFYCVAYNSGEDAPFYYTEPVDFLGSNLTTGGLLNYGVGTTEVTNFYATDRFAAVCDTSRDWYQKGYVAPDVNTTTDSAVTLFQTGNYLGVFNNLEPDMISDWSRMAADFFDTEIVPLYTTAPAAMTQFYQISLWGIPITCENPEKTMQWLNMMYADKDIINLLRRGVEGVHWNFVEGSDTVVDYPEGTDRTNPPYSSVLNVWGDKTKSYVMPPSDESSYKALSDFNASIDADHISVALGYCFNSDVVKTEVAAVADVVKQYQVSLALGVVNPAEALPEFRAALETAGISKVITENQTQFDAWLAEQGK